MELPKGQSMHTTRIVLGSGRHGAAFPTDGTNWLS